MRVSNRSKAATQAALRELVLQRVGGYEAQGHRAFVVRQVMPRWLEQGGAHVQYLSCCIDHPARR